ncbi:MAG: TolC family protein [Flectobacillus sp.]|uniref:TolC family protein n=1 Tax=Flectobacillus sp. TaxID=50419 RepID=UPI003B9D08C2
MKLLHKLYRVLLTSVLIVEVFPNNAQTPTYSLEECRQMALTQNKKIKTAQFQIEASRVARDASKLNDRANIDASVVGLHVGKPLNQLLPSFLGSGAVVVAQPIYTGGQIKLGIQANNKAIEISEGQKAITESELLVSVESAYWQIVQVKEKIVLAQKYKEMLLQLHKELKNAVDAGLTYKNDLLRVEVNLNEAELNIAKAQDGLILAKLNLAQIIGKSNQIDFNITDEINTFSYELLAQKVNDSAELRPEIQVLNRVMELEHIKTSLIKAEHKPQLSFLFSGFASVGNKVNFSNGDSFLGSYVGLLNFSIPIYDWGKNALKVKEQELKIQAKKWELEESKELINLQVQSAWLQLNQTLRKIDLSNLSIKQSEENLRLANDRYKAGTITGKDVLEAQAIWQQAYSSHIDAKVEYKVSLANYKKAIGEIK